jgi:xanthosine utilization system XapX-like protein
MTGRKGRAVDGKFHSRMPVARRPTGAGWQTVAFVGLLLALATAGYKVFPWQWRLAPAGPPCTPSLAVECPIPWLPEAVTLVGFIGSLVGAAVCFFRRQKFGRWLFASAALLAVPVVAWLTEQWIAGGR